MARIRIGVINPAETEKVTIAVPDDAPTTELTDAIVEALNLPARGENGRRVRYHMNRHTAEGRRERLNPRDTLEESEVEDGDTINLTVEMVAGFLNSVDVITSNIVN